jgi:hypothetical protein
VSKKKVKRKSYHVVYSIGLGVWRIKLGGKYVCYFFARKKDAISEAKELARSAELGQVAVHGKDGKIQREYTYGNDPRRYKG